MHVIDSGYFEYILKISQTGPFKGKSRICPTYERKQLNLVIALSLNIKSKRIAFLKDKPPKIRGERALRGKLIKKVR